MALLVDDNENFPQIQWDSLVHQLIPDDFVLADSYATNHVTIEDILSHRTGLPRHDLSYGNAQKATARDIVRSLRHLPLTAELRTKFQYNNIMFVVAAHIIQTVTGQYLGDFLTERIWRPLGMDNTFFTLKDAQGAHNDLARGYYHNDKQYEQVTWMPLHEIAAAGSMISNVLDYTKWIRALINQSKPLSPAVYKALWDHRTLVPPEEPFIGPLAYGLGWQMGTYHGQRFYEHGGRTQAYGAQLIIFPDLEYSIISFANTAETSNNAEHSLLYHLIDEKLEVPRKFRFDWNQQ
jgi:CubicO group peptidase (beta-lactamase class C family)